MVNHFKDENHILRIDEEDSNATRAAGNDHIVISLLRSRPNLFKVAYGKREMILSRKN